MAIPVLTIVGNALKEHNVYAAGEPIKAADAQDVLGALNRILDDWNSDGQASIAEVFTTFATVAALQPHTIGPTGTWVLPVRPVAITGAARESSTGVWTPLAVHDDPDWWLQQSLVSGADVDALYYAPTVPNGELYFSGIPSSVENIKIMTRTVLAAVLLTQSLTLAPGYESAVTLTLMEAIAELFGKTISASLEKRAGKARARIWKNNLRVPSLSAAGLGLPGMSGGRFDARTGTWI